MTIIFKDILFLFVFLFRNPKVYGIALYEFNQELLTKDFKLDLPLEIIHKFEKLPITEWCLIIKQYMRHINFNNFEENQDVDNKSITSKFPNIYIIII
jgi:hypothetical protein